MFSHKGIHAIELYVAFIIMIMTKPNYSVTVNTFPGGLVGEEKWMFVKTDECKTIIVNCIADAKCKSCKAVFKYRPFFPRQPVQLLPEAISQAARLQYYTKLV